MQPVDLPADGERKFFLADTDKQAGEMFSAVNPMKKHDGRERICKNSLPSFSVNREEKRF